MNESLRIGVIGTGIMGKPMARNLLRAGYAVHVHNRTAARCADLVAEGAIGHATPRLLGAASDVVITMVGEWPELQRVTLGEDGALSALGAGGLFIDMGTTSPEHAQTLAGECAEREIDALDAPVSGGEPGAVAGTLTIMAGGSEAAFARALPIFRVLGTNVTRIGDAGAGQIAKACNQLIVALNIEAVAEAFALAKASGVDPARVRTALMGGFADSRILELHGQRMIDRNFVPGGAMRSHLKDAHIISETAARVGLALPAAELVFERIQAIVDRGGGDLDHSALSTLFDEDLATL